MNARTILVNVGVNASPTTTHSTLSSAWAPRPSVESGTGPSLAGPRVDECVNDAGKGAAAVPLCNGARLGGVPGAGGVITGPATDAHPANHFP